MSAESLNEALGIDGFESGDGWARAGFTVAAEHTQPMGIVHGGVFASLAETTASRATHEAVFEDGNYATGQTNETSFLRPISAGRVTAEAKAKHRGRTTWVWDIEIFDEEGRICALSRMTIAVRPIPESLRSKASGTS